MKNVSVKKPNNWCMPLQRLSIQNDFEQENNYDRPNQLSCCILINDVTTLVKGYEQKINYEWP